MGRIMVQTAKIFMNGRSQAIRLPAAFRFEEKEVFIRRDPVTGDLILSRKPENWDGFFLVLENADVPEDFLSPIDRNQSSQDRDPFAGAND
jgi:antitoxin VapB